jgi:hypothetical protein
MVESAVPPVVYVAMLGGTVAGQFLGMAIDAVAVGQRVVWIPLALSVVLEALVGARFGAARVGRPLTAPERRRVTVTYSAALVGVSLPLAAWLAVSKTTGEGASPGAAFSANAAPLWLAAALAGAVVYTAVRYGLMGLFSRRAA